MRDVSLHALCWALAPPRLVVSCALESGPRGDVPSRGDVAPREVSTPNPSPNVPMPDHADPEPVPWNHPAVVVELFSSEGCSSCPPADAVLRDLAEKQPVAGADVLALEMHVDYWNDLGWADPFSSDVYTSRQRAYTSVLTDRSAYTPQMVVDGRFGFVGSQRGTAESAIARAAAMPKAKVAITRTGDTLAITVSEVPEPAPAA